MCDLFKNLLSVRQGKYFELEFNNKMDKNTTQQQVKKMCDKLLVNSIMEDYKIVINDNKKWKHQ